MTTFSIPVDDATAQKIRHFVSLGVAPNIAEFGRKSMQKYLEELAVESILKASNEPDLSGNLDDLLEKI
jgi:hypothetical protein